jgi:hypothetical protein
MPATRLYFICHADDATGEPLDLIVEASSPATAAVLWRDYWQDVYPNVSKPEMVYTLPTPTGTAHPLPWGTIPSAVGWRV